MMSPLEAHPGSSAPPLHIEAEAERFGTGGLALRYRVTGDVGALLLPPPAPPEPADGLWRHTCFEAFVRAHAEAGYFEINLSPSGQWALYRFSDYRAGMEAAQGVPAPRIERHIGKGRIDLEASIDLGPALGLLDRLPWQLGLAAVIEGQNGGLSHWALKHPPGDPDFHRRDCFVLELPPPDRR